MTIAETIEINIDVELTPRESELTTCAIMGFAKKQIAAKKFISVRTVEQTMKNVYEKVGVNSIAQLAVWWWCKNLNIRSLKNPMLTVAIIVTLIAGFVAEIPAPERVKIARVKRARKCEDEYELIKITA